MKKLKFAEKLIEPILDGQKTTTWRLNDDKDLSEGDILILCDLSGEKFANAGILSVAEKTFGELSCEEKKEHGFDSDEEMFSAFSKYYGIEVDESTSLKIIEFKVL